MKKSLFAPVETKTKGTRRRNETAPIEWTKAQDLLNSLAKNKDFENLLLFTCGFYFGLRISDILKLTWQDIAGNEFFIKETKTGKTRKIKVSANFKRFAKIAFDAITKEPAGTDFVFTSHQSNENKAIEVQTANKRIRKVFKTYNVKVQNASSHTLRKTFAKRVYEYNGKSDSALLLLSQILNHANTTVTRLYIGITQEIIADVYDNI